MQVTTEGDVASVAAAAMPEWLSLSAYADHAGVNKSTISRQVGTIIPVAAVRRQGRSMFLHVAAADRARRENVDQAQQRLPAVDVAPFALPGSYAGARARKEHYQAEAAALEHQRRLGELLDRRQVIDAVTQIGLTLRSEFEGRRQLLSIDLAGLTDPSEIMARLEDSDERLLLRLVDEFNRDAGLTDDAVAANT